MNVRIEFDKLGGITPDDITKGYIKPVYDQVNVHMIFDINMDGKLNRKARLKDDCYTTAPPRWMIMQIGRAS